jgi:cycloeucalenol cycloisomerase
MSQHKINLAKNRFAALSESDTSPSNTNNNSQATNLSQKSADVYFDTNGKDKYSSSRSSIFSSNPEKARAEQFFLLWAIVWINIMFYIVYSQWFETFTPYHYLALGLVLFLFPTVLPLLFPSLFLSAHLPITRRYTTKANLYIAILSWIANYFWTHYFYTVLHATYTFKAHRLNDVPFALYMITHSYFHLYHVLSSIMMRVLWRCVPSKGKARYLYVGIIEMIVSYIVAFLETFTIQNFPYYHIPDRHAMYVYGSMFYSLYFVVSFPMFARLDERDNTWNLSATFIDSMACCMIITQLLDFWRITIGHITDAPASNSVKQSVPFVY